MPLTPADVHNVAFSKPPIGKRGYNEDEVDAFLDLVETEFSRLVEENADLRQRVSELDSELASARAGVVQSTQAIPLYQPEPEVAVVVSFAEDPTPGLNCMGFSGSATAAPQTVSFRPTTRTAALQQ